ncbi:MAG: polyribonucleotide nucleotidyltransferase, partial [Myxococcota bacterium]|nr:polyribonucleotide nucleotidyltransferase [Myxococcota bacterium]
DRPLRPQFPKHHRKELQGISTVLSFDPGSDPDVLSLCGISAAFHVSELPLQRAVAGVRVAQVDGELLLNPSREQMDEAALVLVVAGTTDAVCMVEGGGNEVDESAMIDAIDLAHENICKIIGAIDELREKAGKPKIELAPPVELEEALVSFVHEQGQASLVAAMAIDGKHERSTAIKAARNAVIAQVLEGGLAAGLASYEGLEGDALADKVTNDSKKAWEGLVRNTMRGQVLEQGKRIDGRATDEIRFIACEVGIAPRAHGSALFTRGETQAFVTATLGVEEDAQRIDYAGTTETFRRFMLQYNFPPFCTGEARRMMGPKRREVGHGALAHRAVQPIVPKHEDFPYVLRCSSDVTESNGSSSMATVCGSSLALMDAGVPVSAAVAGIAMGLINEGDQYMVLSDILGSEDHLGDMDFKVTGTLNGITAFQMDTKIDSIPREVMQRAMNQAREGRLHILGEMAKTIAEAREERSQYAPRIVTIHIKKDRIRDIIGPGGKIIRGMQERTGCRIKVDDSGRVDIASTDSDAAQQVVAMIRELTQEAEVGKLYYGVVKRVVDFGAFVEIFPGTDGLIHISHLAPERVDRVTDVVNEGDEVL